MLTKLSVDMSRSKSAEVGKELPFGEARSSRTQRRRKRFPLPPRPRTTPDLAAWDASLRARALVRIGPAACHAIPTKQYEARRKSSRRPKSTKQLETLPFDKLTVARRDGARSRILSGLERPRVAVILSKNAAAVLAHIDLGCLLFTRGSSIAIHSFQQIIFI
jgi:hypothetical protein